MILVNRSVLPYLDDGSVRGLYAVCVSHMVDAVAVQFPHIHGLTMLVHLLLAPRCRYDQL